MSIVLLGQMDIAATQTTLALRGLIQSMRASGASNEAIRRVLLSDLNEGGRIFGAFKNAVNGGAKNGVQFASRAGSKAVYEEKGIKEFEWVLTKENNCPDCLEREGRMETWEFWETIGLPQSGFSICQDNCGCELVPGGYKAKDLEIPPQPEEGILTMPDGAKRPATVEMHGETKIFTQKNLDLKRQKLNATDIKRYLDEVPQEYRGIIKEINITDDYLIDAGHLNKDATMSFNIKSKRLSVWRNDRFSINEIDDIMPNAMRHETGHILEDKLGAGFRSEWKKAMNLEGGAITEYAKTDIYEDIAETLANYWSKDPTDRKAVKIFFSERYKVLQKWGISEGG